MSVKEHSHTLLQSHPDWVSMDFDKLGKSFYNNDGVPLSDTIKSLKARTLNDALQNKNTDALAEYSRSTEGLISNEFRMKIWPLLLGISDWETEAYEETSKKQAMVDSPNLKLNRQSVTSFLLNDLDLNDLPPHKDEDQVKLDIQRSFTVLSQMQSYHQLQNESFTAIFSNSDIDSLKKSLLNIIIKILRKYPCLNYYQGYHDIASIILIVCYEQNGEANPSKNEELAFKLLEKLTVFHLRDYMITDINLSINHLKLIPSLLEVTDTDLFELIKQSSNSYIMSSGFHYDYNFYQGLSSILTFYSHDLNNLHQLLIIWDFILSYNSVVVNVYLYVALLKFHKEDIFNELDIDPSDLINSGEADIDIDLVHTLVSPNNLFKSMTDSDLNQILNKTRTLIESYLISDIENSDVTYDVWFKEFNQNSVLLNTSDILVDSKTKDLKYNYLIVDDENPPDSSLNDLVQLQDEEMSKQTVYNISLQQKLLEQQEELSNSTSDLDTSLPNSLSSSITSFTSASSSINTKIANTSSMIFKKLFYHDISPTPEGKLNNNNKHNVLSTNFYRISFTVGFIGFMMHFLLIKNDPSYQSLNITRLVSGSLSMIQKCGSQLLDSESIRSVSDFVVKASNGLVYETGEAIRGMYTSLKDSEIVNSGINIGQIGLGNLRNNIYGFIG
ncbi:DEHA2F13024p [Debaryomyces hansenii CBS767]|uniref:DEHA2F13024p n=1 Tax=Debaryomyces hansenii (strain ATCC 36239 / CBS 767 / BCRC 21394 / JCM 1990 / NBRC 0083 / IGC 2968) TaxID=284592 RepID=Q6BLJ1_DEBHA|nr:DEHA2F13024p [Debaryomyces hansenii CBS767]CAG89284.2 DEHA2F13024p [Debaryomyces hansenii CBS767]|eukprot:XP_460930.2 DEHA2F13024p [Debaryomyces hansenii CBS767]